MKIKTEKEFLERLDTYIKVTMSRLRDGRIIDGYNELDMLLSMVKDRKLELSGKAPWIDGKDETNAEKIPEGKENPI